VEVIYAGVWGYALSGVRGTAHAWFGALSEGGKLGEASEAGSFSLHGTARHS